MTNAELAGKYYTHFTTSKNEIDTLLASPDAQSSVVGKVAQRIQALNKSLTDATPYLPPYDQRRGGDGSAKPGRGKFMFKRRAAAATTTTTWEGDVGKGLKDTTVDDRSVENGSATMGTERQAMPLPSNSTVGPSPVTRVPVSDTSTSQITIQDLSSAYITLDSLLSPPTPTNGGGSHADPAADNITPTGLSITIRNIDRCVIDLRPTPSSTAGTGTAVVQQQPRLTALYGDGVRDSVVIAPGTDVAGSVMLHSLERVVVITACQQFRIHSSADAILLLSIPSNPIIEHSSRLRFGRYPHSLSPAPNAPPPRPPPPAVQDFSWIKPSASPNFRTIGDEESDTLGVQVEQVIHGSGDEWKETLAGFLAEVFVGPS
ncbi:hypothetical protein QFC21_000684 [Naganishia friedmannii]|uniref:Uncharacterized protein n=1 Tax=Naganishia friedmannii TaxID=89922 RepID=A0ACC2WDQ0_9TREE|nr:hypothetical protein QFC21_000684 [Naganishia friedmannii]